MAQVMPLLDLCEKIGQKEFHMSIKLCIDLTSVILNLLLRKQRFAGGTLILNTVALIQMMQNVRVSKRKQ